MILYQIHGWYLETRHVLILVSLALMYLLIRSLKSSHISSRPSKPQPSEVSDSESSTKQSENPPISDIQLTSINWQRFRQSKTSLFAPILQKSERIMIESVIPWEMTPKKTKPVGVNELAKKLQAELKQAKLQAENQRKRKENEERLRKEEEEKEKKRRKAEAKRKKEEERKKAQEEKLERERREREEAEAEAAEAARIEQERADRQREEKETQERLRKEQEERIVREEELRRRQEQEAQAATQRANRERAEREAQDEARRRQLSERLESFPLDKILDTVVQYSQSIQEGDPVETPFNCINDFQKSVKGIINLTESILTTFDVRNQNQVNTFCVKMWRMIVMELIQNAKKEPESIPPSSKDAQSEKTCINCYILMVNIFRVKGHQKIWVYMVGKTLDLLDFIYKRRDIIKSPEELDLYAKNYVKFTSNPPSQSVGAARLDQLTYFLFGILAMNPYDCLMAIVKRSGSANSDEQTQIYERVSQLPRNWDFGLFWILEEQIRKNPFKYFKPFCYSNIFSALYPQYRKYLEEGAQNSFSILYRELVTEAKGFRDLFKNDAEVKAIKEMERRGFSGDDFLDYIEPLAKSLGGEKSRTMAIRDVAAFDKEADVFYYFGILKSASY